MFLVGIWSARKMCLSNIPYCRWFAVSFHLWDGVWGKITSNLICIPALLDALLACPGSFFFKDVMCLCTSCGFRGWREVDSYSRGCGWEELAGEGSKLQRRCQSKVAKGQSEQLSQNHHPSRSGEDEEEGDTEDRSQLQKCPVWRGGGVISAEQALLGLCDYTALAKV